jgi:hypothetical protein
MRLTEVAEGAVGVAKEAKEDRIRQDGISSDIQPQIICWRGDEPVATVILRQHIRDEILKAFRVCAMGFAADTMATIFETYTASYENVPEELRGKNPRTGQDWGEGGMQIEAKMFGALEKGYVREAVAVSVVNRAGDHVFVTLPFHYTETYLAWDDPVTINTVVEEGGLSGHMPKSMMRAMNAPVGEVVARELAARTTRDERDVWTAGLIMGNVESIVILFADTQERAEIIQHAGLPLW